MKKTLGWSLPLVLGIAAAAFALEPYSSATPISSPSSYFQPVSYDPSATMSATAPDPVVSDSADPTMSATPIADGKDLVFIDIEASAVQDGSDRPIPDNSKFTVELSKNGMVFFKQEITCLRDGKLQWQPSGLKGFSTSDMIAVRVTGTLNGVSMAGNQTFQPLEFGQGLEVEGTMQLKPVEQAPAPSPKP